MPLMPSRRRKNVTEEDCVESLKRVAAHSVPKEDKVTYVRQQGQERDHHCHWPGCKAQVPPAEWGCYRHWMMLPKSLRDKIGAAFRPGQEKNLTPSREYVKVAHEVRQWIKTHHHNEA